jgi:hypothetical protein
MTWASTNIIAASLNINAPVSSDTQSVLNPMTMKISPVNSSGAKFDFTAATSLRLTFLNSVAGLTINSVVGAQTPTIVAHDATGLTFSLTAVQLTQIATGLGAASAQVTIQATDGTTPLDVALGRIQFTPQA